MKRVFLALLFLALFWAGDKVTYQVRTDIDAGLPATTIIDQVLDDLTHAPLHVSLAGTDLAGGAIAAGFGGLLYVQKTLNNRQRRRGEEHGSASWGTSRDIRRFAASAETENLLFTRSERLALDSRKTQRNLNALVIGSSGSGKSRYYVMPNLAQANTSFVITDPKGELYRETSTYLTERGYQVRVLNLIDFAASQTFNPLTYFNAAQAEVDCTILTENFVANTTGKKPAASGDFWEKAERALLNALISYVYATKGPDGSMVDVVDMLARMQASESDENQRSEIDLIYEAVDDLVAETSSEDPDSFTEDALQTLGMLRFSASQYRTYTQGAGETKKSVIISLGVRMAPLHMAQIRRLLATDSIGLDRIGQEKTALYLILPDTHAAFNFLAAIFYEQLFETNLRLADHSGTGRLAHQVQCFMDEFANIGLIPSFERKIAVMRSRGISVSVVIQNFSQGKARYKDDWETIVGNCDSLLFLGGTEKSTTEYISKLLGKQTIVGSDTSQSKGRQGSYSISDRRLGRELLTPDEIGRLPGDECIYILRGVRPFRSKKLAAPSL